MAGDEGDSDGEGPGGLTDAQRELRRVLQKTHLSSGSEDGDGRSSSVVSDEDEDDVDLDEMASDLLPKVSLSHSTQACWGCRQLVSSPYSES